MNALKQKLQGLGALRPEAWERIVQLSQQCQIAAGGSFIRKEGALAYVASGLLKEYDAQNRVTPSIINFITADQCFHTGKHHQHHYLKTSMPTCIYFWEYDALQSLYYEFRELKSIYEFLCAAYEASILYRQLILENKSAKRRLLLFIDRYREQMPFISKRDMSRYLMLNYDYLTSIFSDLI